MTDYSWWICCNKKNYEFYNIKKYKPITKKKKKSHDAIVLLAKTNLDCIKTFTSSSFTNSFIERKYFLLIDVLIECDDVNEKIDKIKTSSVN